MLIKLSCKIFRSIGSEPIALDMIASTKIKMHENHMRPLGNNAYALRNAAIYGGNAAGKSNIIRILSLMQAAVMNGFIPQMASQEFCRAGSGFENHESVFELQFEKDGQVFDYGFSCILNKLSVQSEWLYDLGDAPRLLFERFANGSVSLGDDLGAGYNEQEETRLSIYTSDFTGQAKQNPSLLFLSAIGRGKSFESGTRLESFARAFNWFAENLLILVAGQPSPTSDFYRDDTTLDQVAEVLASFDTGVSALAKRFISLDELNKRLDPSLLAMIRNLMTQSTQNNLKNSYLITARTGKEFVGIESSGGSEPQASLLEIQHSGSRSLFDFGDESDGTQRLFDFMDILFSKKADATFVVDEIDRSLHPMLTQQLIDLFNKSHVNDTCQLVFTTHESAIMSFDYLRKDEIWFIDRNEIGTSHLYSLDDFAQVGKVRTDSRIDKQYLEGRYGGVPCLSSVRALAALNQKEA